MGFLLETVLKRESGELHLSREGVFRAGTGGIRSCRGKGVSETGQLGPMIVAIQAGKKDKE